MKNINKKLLSILFSLIFIFSTNIVSFAGEGDGSGGGQGNPVTIQSISINDGATNVELKPYIVINFSKNVINMSVKENNKNCFSMKDENGNKIFLNIIMADDQVEPEKKRIISVTPKNKLKEGEKYTLYISANIKSKSGDNLDYSRSISFKTKGSVEVSKDDKEDNDTTKPSDNKKPNTTTKPSNDTTTNSTVKEETSKDTDKVNKNAEEKKDDNKSADDKALDKEEEKEESNNTEEISDDEDPEVGNTVDTTNEQIKDEKKMNMAAIIAVGLVVVVIGIYIYIKKVRK